MLILATEVGVLDIPPEKIVRKSRFRSGRMLLVDMTAASLGMTRLRRRTPRDTRMASGWTATCCP